MNSCCTCDGWLKYMSYLDHNEIWFDDGDIDFSGNPTGGWIKINYCPWCGKKLEDSND